jgi:hypothetical protein
MDQHSLTFKESGQLRIRIQVKQVGGAGQLDQEASLQLEEAACRTPSHCEVDVGLRVDPTLRHGAEDVHFPTTTTPQYFNPTSNVPLDIAGYIA